MHETLSISAPDVSPQTADDAVAMPVASEQTYTIRQYLALEKKAETRHEYHNGKIIEMAGGTIPHNAVKGRFFSILDRAVEALSIPNVVLNSDTKVRIEHYDRFVYPDITVSDGMPQYYVSPDGKVRRDVIVNPLVIVEVLSNDTRFYDKGEKFEFYASLPCFREYILVEPEICRVKSSYLQDPENGLWKIQTFTEPEDVLKIYTLDISFPLKDLYAILQKLPQ